MSEKPRAIRPDDVEPDPRTDGVEDDGERDLPPLDNQSMAEAVEQDDEHRRRTLASSTVWHEDDAE